MTSKGQVTVPKDIRDALGLMAGQPVRFELDDEGNARILKADDAFSLQKREDHYLKRLEEARVKFRSIDMMPGMDGLDYQRKMRGDGPEV